ncbi:MAG: NAD(P)-dependent oxidoreductase [SAR202 cluster bacterium]|nr:NAD(P)-dependent oxidoreductase [SAR202 cluster bacterium]
MRVLITGGATRLAQDLAKTLSVRHDVVLTDRSELPSGDGYAVETATLSHTGATDALVRGVDAIVHGADTGLGKSESDRLDLAMRCTYNLLWAAVEEGVGRVVLLSSLQVMDGYDEDMTVTETWRPVPTTDLDVLSHYLSESVCREFGRERKTGIICLRLGDLVWGDEGEGVRSSSALYFDDAAQAVERAMAAERLAAGPDWNLLHIQSAVARARFATAKATNYLEYSPAERA